MKRVIASVLWTAFLMGSVARSDVPTTSPAAAERSASTGYSATALYNSANAYARAGKPGLAVLNYERAKLLDPNDPDIEANLNRTRQTASLPPESPTVLNRLIRRIPPDGVAWIGFVGLLIAGGSMLSRELLPKHRGRLLAAAVFGFCLLSVTLASAISVWPTLHQAVVVGHSVPARVSPTLIEETLFVLPEADIVSVSAEHDGFMLVKNRAGRTGWAPNSNLALIVPGR
jgi:hypothetical protein